MKNKLKIKFLEKKSLGMKHYYIIEFE